MSINVSQHSLSHPHPHSLSHSHAGHHPALHHSNGNMMELELNLSHSHHSSNPDLEYDYEHPPPVTHVNVTLPIKTATSSSHSLEHKPLPSEHNIGKDKFAPVNADDSYEYARVPAHLIMRRTPPSGGCGSFSASTHTDLEDSARSHSNSNSKNTHEHTHTPENSNGSESRSSSGPSSSSTHTSARDRAQQRHQHQPRMGMSSGSGSGPRSIGTRSSSSFRTSRDAFLEQSKQRSWSSQKSGYESRRGSGNGASASGIGIGMGMGRGDASAGPLSHYAKSTVTVGTTTSSTTNHEEAQLHSPSRSLSSFHTHYSAVSSSTRHHHHRHDQRLSKNSSGNSRLDSDRILGLGVGGPPSLANSDRGYPPSHPRQKSYSHSHRDQHQYSSRHSDPYANTNINIQDAEYARQISPNAPELEAVGTGPNRRFVGGRRTRTGISMSNTSAPGTGTVPVAVARDSSSPAPGKSILVTPSYRKAKVSFSTVEVRQYERILGDNPGVSSGPPISIGWNFYEERTICIPVDDYEFYHCGYRDDCEMVLSRDERQEMLLDLGFSQKDIAKMIRQNHKVKRLRRQTLTNLYVMPLEEVVESAKKSVSRIFISKNQRKHKRYVKEWRQADSEHSFDDASLSTNFTPQCEAKGILKVPSSGSISMRSGLDSASVAEINDATVQTKKSSTSNHTCANTTRSGHTCTNSSSDTCPNAITHATALSN